MAKFTVAGKTNCPHFAKAELLADTLQRRLPDFRVHKISVLPEDWEEWLEATCQGKGFQHERSPLVWRDLVVQGGKSKLLGGFSDFLEHCQVIRLTRLECFLERQRLWSASPQEFYGVSFDMPSELMLNVAAENLQTKQEQTEEEQRRIGLIQPFHIWISGALSPSCPALIPRLLSADVFPGVSAISLHLLDLQGPEDDLHALKMDTEDLNLHVLHQVTVQSDVERAFSDADLILLLDDDAGEGDATEDAAAVQEGDPEEEGAAVGKSEPEDQEAVERGGAWEERRREVQSISQRYRQYGRLIDSRARREVKVIVSGDSHVNLRCSLLVECAASLDGQQFVAMATQLENEAKAVLAKRLNVKTADVTDVIVWGNISGAFHVDLQMAKVSNFDGPIQGPPFFRHPVLKVLHDRKWLEKDLQHLTGCERAAVAAKTGRASSMAAANAILTILEAWNGVTDSPRLLSAGVVSQGHFNVPAGVVFSVPVTFGDGSFSVLDGVRVGHKLQEKLQRSVQELLKVVHKVT